MKKHLVRERYSAHNNTPIDEWTYNAAYDEMYEISDLAMKLRRKLKSLRSFFIREEIEWVFPDKDNTTHFDSEEVEGFMNMVEDIEDTFDVSIY